MKTRIFNLIILDESGSMSSIEKQAITGVNETVQTIRNAQKRHEDQEHFISLVSYNSDDVKSIYDCMEAEKVEELTAKQRCQLDDFERWAARNEWLEFHRNHYIQASGHYRKKNLLGVCTFHA